MEHLLDHGETIVVNLGTGRGVSVRQVIDVVRDVTGRPVAVHNASRRSGDPSVLVADPTKASELLGWSRQRSDPTMIISDAWRWPKTFHLRGRRLNPLQDWISEELLNPELPWA